MDHRLQSLRKKLADDKSLAKIIHDKEKQVAKQECLASGKKYVDQDKSNNKIRGNLKKQRSPRNKSANYRDKSIDELVSAKLTQSEISAINAEIAGVKKSLKDTIDRNIGIDRHIRLDAFKPYNIVSIFDSCLTRCLDMSTTGLNDHLVIVKVYYFGVAENIIKRGFYWGDEHYVFFSASAGQIRTKKFVAIKESAFSSCMNQLTCGLSADTINASGGVNINKYLAYLALCNSATTPWTDFDIDKTIVIDDFETEVPGTVDFIDDKTYKIERKDMRCKITHTDGCGLILPRLSQRNFMVRAPWIKGLLTPFAFDKFIMAANSDDPSVNHGLITDIYGQEHDILNEDIEVIFTKSQVKMAKYYENWSQYQENFKKYACSAGKCNEEPDFVEDATFNYQMLQTLTSMTDDELSAVCEKTNRKLRDMASDRRTMLHVFGATKPEDDMNAYQKCLAYYPELLQDPYSREVLRDLKNSIEFHALGGRLDIDGKYLFLIPDVYAACQHWFLGIAQPTGLLQNGEVSCRAYEQHEKVDALRSPHLYMEHAVRRNVYGDKPELRQWLQTDGIYTSSWDMISRILQFDNDGDKSLVCVDKTIIEVAERDGKDVVPLYYEMAKAAAIQVTPETKYDGMLAAWTGGNIGEISNAITRIWASEHPDLDAIKILVMENNFVIDYAKTLYKPTRPPEWESRIKDTTVGKVPQFFVYAKDKELTQVEPMTDCLINRLSHRIQNYKFDFKKKQLGFFDYKKLMHDKDIVLTANNQELINTYYKLTARVGMQNVDISDDDNTYVSLMNDIYEKLSEFGDDQHVTDVLIWQLFHNKKTKHKNVFWFLYGDIVYKNLLANHAGSEKMCLRCGKRFIPNSGKQKYCHECMSKKHDEDHHHHSSCLICGTDFIPDNLHQTICPVCQWMKDHPPTTDHTAICIDCGAVFEVSKKRGRKPKLCPRCQKQHELFKKVKWARANL